MRQGQTNGISQGSVLMDLIAEMILGYSDTELAEKVKNQGVTDYEILRFRDDYRIFVNNPQDGEIILKCLTETMIDLGLKLNPAKTRFSGDVITSSLKDDKLSWLFRKQGDSNIRKQLLIIRDHSMAHPNSGSLEVALNEYHRRISRLKRGLGFESPTALISIIVDIAYRNPRTYPVSAAVLSCLLDFLGSQGEKQRTIERIRRKFSQIPNTGHLDVWLQRITQQFGDPTDYDEPLCKLIHQQHEELWNNDWISSKALKNAIDTNKIVDPRKLSAIPPTIPPREIELFATFYS